MTNEDIFGRVMHIDTSGRFKQKMSSGIAFKMIDTGIHKGCCISNSLKRNLDRDLEAQEDYARIYAICIYYLIKDSLDEFDTLIICNDEHFLEVKLYLDNLFSEDLNYSNKAITDLNTLRKIMGDDTIESYAHGIAGIYRKKALLCIQRRQRGIPLNIVDINYQIIYGKWEEINK